MGLSSCTLDTIWNRVLWTRYFVYVGHEVTNLRIPNFEGPSYQQTYVEKESRSLASKFAVFVVRVTLIYAGGP